MISFNLRTLALASVFAAVAIAAEVKVKMTFATFFPKDITIKVGDTVKWTHGSFPPHTATSDMIGDMIEFDSHIMLGGDTYSHEFKQPGVYKYHCTLNPITMFGSITVVE
ncbi:hypothetical protein BGW38_004685 [Lunasporangiospora selenospora]|uniref:Blue (type 1) copper domain-containing protein n=1 Tax=Lunasporangiospora selenospora TaxID=979761 RepID=A0A9P6G265_9FUNG|nr:hypothetical protein BGW38_004685 [Lunasporangiospora selenospora]